MSDIALTAAAIGRVDPTKDEVYHALLAATVTAGQVVYLTTAGTWDLGDGSATGTAQARGLALEGGGAGQAVTIMKQGLVHGFTLSGLAYDARLYLSNTAGALADAAGTVPVTMGRVWAMTDADKTKVLYFIGAQMEDQYT